MLDMETDNRLVHVLRQAMSMEGSGE